jgi:hypothetical protein
MTLCHKAHNKDALAQFEKIRPSFALKQVRYKTA